MVKIIDKIKALDEEQTFFSYEYFPPKTDAGVLNLFDRIDRMARTEPLFCDCTWGAGGSNHYTKRCARRGCVTLRSAGPMT